MKRSSVVNDVTAVPVTTERCPPATAARRSSAPPEPTAGEKPVHADLDDGALARGIAAGDSDAAGELVGRYQTTVRSFLLRLTGRRELADDLAQDTFVRVLRYAGRYDARYPMKTWLLTIARRLSINHARDSRRQVVGFDSWEHSATQAGDTPFEQVAAADEAVHQRSLLDAAMDELSHAQREAVVLFYQQDQSVSEIADVMQIPEGTVKSHLHRGRAVLKKNLSPTVEGIES